MALSRPVNSPWRADDDADNQSGDNRGDSAHTSISTVPPFCWILQSGCQPPYRTVLYWRPAVKPRYCCNGRFAWRISPRSIIGKAPRSLICCNATASWLFGERKSLNKLLAVSIHQREEAGSVRRLLIWVLGLAWQVCEGDQVIQ